MKLGNKRKSYVFIINMKIVNLEWTPVIQWAWPEFRDYAEDIIIDSQDTERASKLISWLISRLNSETV